MKDFIWLQFWRPKVSSLKLLHLSCKISHLLVQDRFQIPYFSSPYGTIERTTTRTQSAALANKTLQKFQTRWTTLLPLWDS